MRTFNFFTEYKTHYKNYLILLIICLTAFWPLTFGIYSVKNDAIHYFLPFRYNIGEAIRNNEWPFWSPYIYLGYPIFGDMQSGAWNPIVWLFSLISRYNITVFHYENLFYILLGGIGMYKLSFHLIKHSQTALLLAVSYMLSGFMLNGQLINWLASAAFIPFVCLYYLQLSKQLDYINAIKTGIATYLLFTTGYPSFFILTLYLISLVFIFTIVNTYKKKKEKKFWSKFFLTHFVLLIVFTGLSLPAFISYLDLLPYYQRGNGISFSETIINSFEWQHLLSFIFPSSIKAVNLNSSTDVTFRNVYIGLLPLIILITLPPKLSRRNIFLLALAIFSLLFSLGDVTPLRKLCYNFIPLMNTFRHPSQMRLFFIFSLLLLSAPGLKKLLTNNLDEKERSRIQKISLLITLILIIISGYFIINSPFHPAFSDDMPNYSILFKNLIDNLTIQNTISINGLLQVFFMVAFLIWLYRGKNNFTILSFIWISNLVLFTILILPITFVSKISAKEINKFIVNSPEGFPVYGLDRTLQENSTDAASHFEKIALTYFYNKKIGISHITNSPSFLTEQEQFLESPILYKHVASLPVYYFADTVVHLKDTNILNSSTFTNYAFTNQVVDQKTALQTGDEAVISKLTTNKFVIETSNISYAYLVLTQNFHHDWRLYVDGKPGKIYKTNLSFMGCVIPPGNHEVVFSFIPRKTIAALWVQLATVAFLIIIFLFFFLNYKRKDVYLK